MTAVRHLGQVHRRGRQGRAVGRAQTHDLDARAHDALDRLAARARELRLRLRSASSATSACPRSPAAPTSSPASSLRQPDRAGRGAARSSARGLGMAVEVFDERRAQPVAAQKGELVCTAPFPSMPVGFWNDPGRREATAPPISRRYPGVWCHGDYVELTEHDGVIIYGRSDAVLNPGGVRIGTAEIYRQVEQLDGGRREPRRSAQDWERRRARRAVRAPARRPRARRRRSSERIRRHIRDNTTPRHVPAQDRCRSPTSRAPRAARSSSSRCATSCTAGRSAIRLAPTPALALFAGRPELALSAPLWLAVHGGAGSAPAAEEEAVVGTNCAPRSRTRSSPVIARSRAAATRAGRGGGCRARARGLPWLNAGRGSVLCATGGGRDGRRRDGRRPRAPPPARSPACAACEPEDCWRRAPVLERSPHVLLAGTARIGSRASRAWRARRRKLRHRASPPAAGALAPSRSGAAARPTGGGTVGAVARDAQSHLAAATSTGEALAESSRAASRTAR